MSIPAKPLSVRPGMTLVEIARTQLGVRETSRNRGPELVKFWDATNYQDGDENREPWCAAFVCWVVMMAGRTDARLKIHPLKRPQSAAVKQWVPTALRLGWKVFGPRDGMLFPAPGDIVVFTHSHIGIVEDFTGHTVKTIEGNTNDEGSREGFEVARRNRELSECRSFIRIPTV